MRFLFFLCWLVSLPAFAQITPDSLTVQIPADWVGKWAGKLHITDSQGAVTALGMELNIAKTNNAHTWEWTIVYINGTNRQDRKYQLIAQNAQKGWYKIDEKNGIILDGFYAQGALASVFEVENNLLTSVYRREGKALVFEVYMCITKTPNLSGGNVQGIPVVKSYPIRITQKAVLTKKRK